MSSHESAPHRHQFYIAVTGHAETDCIPRMIRRLLPIPQHQVHVVVRKVHQRPRERIKAQKSNKNLVLPDHVKMLLDAGKTMRHPQSFLLWIDDLEKDDDRKHAEEHFRYMTESIDQHISHPRRSRCSAHFLVNMLEAYFLADAAAINGVDIRPRGSAEPQFLDLRDHSGNCEDIKNPKAVLEKAIKAKCPNSKFDEIEHGGQIVKNLDLEKILADPTKCRALRTLVAWCYEAIGEPRTETFCLTNGTYWNITSSQLSETPPHVDPLGEETAYCPLAS